MPFGIASASEIFQREVEKIIEKVTGAINAQDDIIIWGRSKQELKRRVRKVMREVRKFEWLKTQQDQMCVCSSRGKVLRTYNVS